MGERTVTLAELMKHGTALGAEDAVAIAHGVALATYVPDVDSGPFPSLDRVAIEDDHVLVIEGTTLAASRTVVNWLGALLHGLLSYVDRQAGAIPADLKTIVTRATGHKFGEPATPIETDAFPRFSSVDDFLTALAPYLPEDPSAAVRTIFERFTTPADEVGPVHTAEKERHRSMVKPRAAELRDSVDSEPLVPIQSKPAESTLTFADLRKRREAAGVSLASISGATKVPLNLLEDLERGDVSRWPSGLYARAHLTAYAEHVGLPVDDVLGLVLEEVMRARPQETIVIETPNWPAATAATTQPARSPSPYIPALLVVGTLATFALGGPIVRYFRNQGEPQVAAAASTAPAESRAANEAAPAPVPDPRYAPPPVSSPPPVPTMVQRPGMTPSVPRPPTEPLRTPPPAVPVPRPMGTTGRPVPGVTLPVEGPAVPAPLDPVAVEALRSERLRITSELDANRKQVIRAEEERKEVGMLLENAQSEQDAAAFRRRLDEIAEQLTTLGRSKQRLTNSLQAIERQLRPPGQP